MSIIERAVDKLEPHAPAAPRPRDRELHLPPPPPRSASVPEELLEPRAAEVRSSAPERLVDAAVERFADEPVRDLHVPGEGRRSREVKIDLEHLKAIGILTPGDEASQIAEECRLVKRPLLHAAFGPDGALGDRRNLVMVTSSVPGEGKTFLSISLAMSMAAELDRTVLLVDGDVIRNGVSLALGLEPGEGLTDVLAGKVGDLSSVMLRTDVPKLTLLPAGQLYPNATELLASDAMKAVVDELSRRYADRVVVFDSPPLLAASGSSVLARLMGQVVLVVEAERTPRTAVKESLRLLNGCSVAGIVLNKTRGRLWGSYSYRSGYYYGYGYKGYGYGREQASTQATPS